MLKKRLIASTLAAGVVSATLSMAGCGKNDIGYGERVGKDLVQANLIVACIERNEQNEEIRKLHRADEYTIGHIGYSISYTVGAPYLDFKCSKNDKKTYAFDAYPDGFPQESEYDEVCEECFPQMKN